MASNKSYKSNRELITKQKKIMKQGTCQDFTFLKIFIHPKTPLASCNRKVARKRQSSEFLAPCYKEQKLRVTDCTCDLIIISDCRAISISRGHQIPGEREHCFCITKKAHMRKKWQHVINISINNEDCVIDQEFHIWTIIVAIRGCEAARLKQRTRTGSRATPISPGALPSSTSSAFKNLRLFMACNLICSHMCVHQNVVKRNGTSILPLIGNHSVALGSAHAIAS